MYVLCEHIMYKKYFTQNKNFDCFFPYKIVEHGCKKLTSFFLNFLKNLR